VIGVLEWLDTVPWSALFAVGVVVFVIVRATEPRVHA
jgi:hypothetical protein